MVAPSHAIGHLTLHPHRELLDRGAPVAIGGRALDLLSALAAADGAVLSKDELLAAVWNGTIVEDNALQAQVSAVRKALGSEASRLVTVHGRGYRLDLNHRPAAAAPPQPASVAVLPFENRTGDSANDYLADGIAEELIAALSRIPDLKVPARSSSFAYRTRGFDVRTVGRELGVATVLEGSMRVGGGRLRVTAALIDVANGFHLWSEDFEHDLADLLALQDGLGSAIAGALSRRLLPRAAGPASSEAMNFVLQSRQMARTLDADAMRRAEDLARQAIALDPGYADAWACLAGVLYVRTTIGAPPYSTLAEALDHAKHALSLDPDCGAAHVILIGLTAFAGDWLAAAEHHQRCREMAAANPGGFAHFAMHVLLPVGRAAEAVALTDRTLALAPAQPHLSLMCATCLMFAGDFEGARRHLATAFLLGERTDTPAVEFVRSEEAYARSALEDACATSIATLARQLDSASVGAVVRQVFEALAGKLAADVASRAAAELFEAVDRSGAVWRDHENAGYFLRWQVRLGALDEAFAVASRIVARWREIGHLANGSLMGLWFADMAPFRRDRRFQDFVRDLGLFAYWDRYGPPDGHEVRDGRLVVL